MAESILQYPDPCLLAPSTPATQSEAKKIVKQLKDVYDKLPETKVGLAAPQIGINKRVVLVMGEPMANPTFLPANKHFEHAPEGCFSVENATTIHHKSRPDRGWVEWMDPETWTQKREKVRGLVARVVQHEIDHLDGRLCNS